MILMEMQGARSSRGSFEGQGMELTLPNTEKGAKDPNRHFSGEGTRRPAGARPTSASPVTRQSQVKTTEMLRHAQ